MASDPTVKRSSAVSRDGNGGIPAGETLLSIMLIDDHDVVRRGLRSMIEAHPGWSVCCEASDGRAAVTMVADCSPDVVVTDLGMPELHGLESIRRIRQASPASELIVFSMYETEYLVREAI